MESATRRSSVNMQGNEIMALKPYIDLCEWYRNTNPKTIHEGDRSRFVILRNIYMALEHLVLYAIDLINLIEAFSFAEEAQDAGYYRTTILKHMCVHIDDLNKRLNEQITGKVFQDAISQVNSAFRNADSLRVPDDFNQLRKEYNKRMEPDRQYIHEIRTKIAAHTESDIDVYINVNKSLDVERISSVSHYTLTFVLKFFKASGPLSNETLGRVTSTH